MESLFRLQDRVEKLLHRYSLLKTEQRNLQAKLLEKEEELAQLRTALDKAELKTMALELGAAIPEPGERESTRRHLDEVIAEIDKILMNLP